jgi:hypothetical protein
VSFLDEELDDRPRRTGSRRPPPHGPGVDQQTLWVRRGIAIAIGVIVVVVLVFGIKSCVSARKKQAFRNYNRDLTSWLQTSDQQRNQLFDLLKTPTSGTPSPVDLTNNANGVKVQAEQLVDQVDGASHPGELDGAHRYLVDVLEFRRDGIARVAEDLRTALGDTGRQAATTQMAADMQDFLVSDVIYSQRFTPQYQEQLKKQGLLDEEKVPTSAFLPNIQWLVPNVVANRLNAIRGGGSSTSTTTTPGLHGTSLDSVVVKPGGQTLSTTQAVDIPYNSTVSFDVKATNGGDNDESNVKVRLTITGGGKAIPPVEATIASFPKGTQQTVNVPIVQKPNPGVPVKITVQVLKVPGETKLDNNKAIYPAVFTR